MHRRISRCSGVEARKCNWGEWVSEITQSPFGWTKVEPSALALNRMWDSNGVAVVLRQRRQSCEGVVFTLFDRPSCVVVVRRKCRCDSG